jgi:predicted transcriptional regulator
MTRFTAAEAAYVLRQPIRAVKKAMDNGPIRPIPRPGPGLSVRVIDRTDLFYLFAVRALRDTLTPAARGEFYRAMRRAGTDCADEVRFGRFRVAVADLVDELEKRTAELAELRAGIALSETGTPVLESRGIEVHRIAALLNGGLSANAVREEYPSLSKAAIETARAYARACPKPGRPYPRTTANRITRGDIVP